MCVTFLCEFTAALIMKAPQGSGTVDTDGWNDQSCPHNLKHKVMIHDTLLCICSCRLRELLNSDTLLPPAGQLQYKYGESIFPLAV